MARSRRKTPVTGITTATSEKEDKRQWNHQLRVAVRTSLKEDADMIPKVKAVGRSYGEKDGKQRFDPEKFPDLMRK